MSVAILITIVSMFLAFAAWNLELHRKDLQRFLNRKVVQRVTFDEVVFGIPGARLPEATSRVLWAVVLLLLGGVGVVTLGLGLLVLVRVAPVMVLPTILFGYAARVGWAALTAQLGRTPVVRRLRLTQPRVVVDEVELGLDPSDEAVEEAPLASQARAVSWADVVQVDVDDAGCIVIGVRASSDLVFGPLPPELAQEIVAQLRRRRARESTDSAEIIDLARARLRALRDQVDRSD